MTTRMTYKKANRRYRAVFIPMIALYCVLCIGGALLLNTTNTPPGWLKHAISIFTIAPILIVFCLIWRYVHETDEYTRLRQLEALAIAGMVTASAAGLIGFMQLYEAIPDFPVFMLLPVFFLSYGLAKWLRGSRECV